MKKILATLIIGLMMLPAYSNDTEGKPRPVIKNYQEVLSQVKYPKVCRTKGIEGTVKVKISVDQNGEMTSFKVLEFPCTDLKKAVEDVLAELEFEPASKDGKPVAGKIIVPVDFKLTI